MANRVLKNSKLNPNTGDSNETTGDASSRATSISEAVLGAASGWSFEERQAAKAAVQTGTPKAT